MHVLYFHGLRVYIIHPLFDAFYCESGIGSVFISSNNYAKWNYTSIDLGLFWIGIQWSESIAGSRKKDFARSFLNNQLINDLSSHDIMKNKRQTEELIHVELNFLQDHSSRTLYCLKLLTFPSDIKLKAHVRCFPILWNVTNSRWFKNSS